MAARATSPSSPPTTPIPSPRGRLRPSTRTHLRSSTHPRLGSSHRTRLGSSHRTRPELEARRARVAVLVLFTLFGTLAGSWLARVADVKNAVGLNDQDWGTLAQCGSVGSLVAMVLSTVLITRLGARRMSRIATPMALVGAPVLAACHTPVQLGVALVFWGVSTSLLQAPINSAAVVVERAYRRPIMGTFHAGFSVGTLLGALLGAIAGHLHVALDVQLAATSLILGALLAATTGWMPADEVQPDAALAGAGHRAGTGTDLGTGRRPGRLGSKLAFTPQIGLLAALAFGSALCEGTTSQWSSIYVHQSLGASTALGALAYATFSGCMSLGRITGDRVVHRVGRSRFLLLAPLLAAGGMAIGLLVHTSWAAFPAFALVGLGLSCVTPTVFGTAGNQPGIPSGRAIATVSIASWPAFLAGPPLVGTISHASDLRWALFVVVLAAIGVSLTSRLVHTPDGPVPVGAEDPAGAPATDETVGPDAVLQDPAEPNPAEPESARAWSDQDQHPEMVITHS